jgi:hypothetical protein
VICFLLVLAAQAPLDGIPGKITFETKAVPISKALREIGDKQHLSLVAEADIGREPIIIHVDGVPVSTLLKKIAVASSGRWNTVQNGLSLSFDQSELASEAAQDEQLKLESLTEAVGNSRAYLKGAGMFTEATALKSVKACAEAYQLKASDKISSYGDFGSSRPPMDRVSELLWVALGPKALSEVKNGVVSFSDKPSREQRLIDPQLYPVTKSFATESQIWNHVVNQVVPKYPKSKDHLDVFMIYPSAPKAVRFVASVFVVGRIMYNLAFSFYDKAGKVVAGTNWRYEVTKPTGFRKLAALPKGDPSKSFALSAETTSALNQFVGKERPATKELMSPASYDPLYWIASEMLIALARHRGDNLVASVEDDLAAPSSFETERVTAYDTWSSGKHLDEAGGWLTVRPNYPALAIATRTNREDLQHLVDSLRNAGEREIEIIADYDYHHQAPSHVVVAYEAMAVPQREFGFESATPLSIFYGSLADEQRKSMRSGVLVSALTAEQQDLLAQAVYSGGMPTSQGSTAMELGKFEDVLKPQITELLPNGIPLDARLTLREDTGPAPRPNLHPGAIIDSFDGGRVSADVMPGMERRDLHFSLTTPSGKQFEGVLKSVIDKTH